MYLKCGRTQSSLKEIKKLKNTLKKHRDADFKKYKRTEDFSKYYIDKIMNIIDNKYLESKDK
ncbi:hypothetical protein BN85401830 [Alteracholeplasma palmae J233]|uniref:Uncharacterized protein n=1 Tax=Alteracholeplasma palmae (strain ATCC 49389 / J233) TaxID=1318466 RepID=U4KNJ3_ALTPJ|nr:hypothetical protein [Alteracholeplasma palmae]CCV63760.1 hypothetical protein BN85401830 [Alteracholeplasma palmae J233]